MTTFYNRVEFLVWSLQIVHMKYLFLILLFSQTTFAADLPKLQTLFKNNFSTFYVSRQCGKNIEKLIKAADAQKIDLTNSYVVSIVNPGFWPLQAFNARGYKQDQRQSWGHHVVLVADNQVFDFDFTNQPRMVPFNKYFKEMFVPKGKIDINYDFKRDVPDFIIDLYASHDYIKHNGSNSTPKQTYKLKDLIDFSRF